jgi:hypothetical protein
MIDLHKQTDAPVDLTERPIGEVCAGTPPFPTGLEYCAPARGHWTIAHTPMLIPGSYMIYLCASACMRGVVLSVLEYEGMDRFSMVILKDEDIYEGNLEQVMIDGICEIIDGLKEHPPIVMPFTSCIHHFLACDTTYIYEVLRKRYPDIDFVECFMIPTIRKGHITPEELMQVNLYDALEEGLEKDRSVNIIGCNYAADPANDYCIMLREAGFRLRDLPAAETYQEYKDMARSAANLYTAPVARFSAQKLEKRLNQQNLYLPAVCTFPEIRRELTDLAETLQIPLPDLDAMQAEAEAAAEKARKLLGDIPIALDHEVIPRFCSMARMLTELGFHVTDLYSDYVLSEDQEDLDWLKQHAPEIVFHSTSGYACRMEENIKRMEPGRKILALGQKAAYFTGTAHFVNMLECNGLWGFHGIVRLMELMMEAYEQESNVPEIISVKAWGCHA